MKKLIAAIALLLFLVNSGAAFDRPAMLQAMARNCITAGLNELAKQSTQLSGAAQELLDRPSTNSLAQAQRAWVEFHLAYKRNQMLTRGPVKDNAFWGATFFKAFPPAIENVLTSSKPINADSVEVLGALAKGPYAMEYLLFDGPKANVLVGQTNKVVRFATNLLSEIPGAQRRRVYLRELARDVEKRLLDAAAEARADGFAAKFTGGGQDSVNLLVNQVIVQIETGVIEPLELYMNQMRVNQLRYDAVEGLSSGTSVSGMQAALEGAHRFYLGGDGAGIDDYVRNVNPGTWLEPQFQSTKAALAAINMPLDEAVRKNPSLLQRVIDEARKLEILCKVDVVSDLGVTIMFNANDGD